MTKNLIVKKRSFSIEQNNPYRTRDIIIEGSLIDFTKIKIKVQQVDWTLNKRVDERVCSYIINAEYDYAGLIKHLYKELRSIKNSQQLIESWVENKKLTFNFTYKK